MILIVKDNSDDSYCKDNSDDSILIVKDKSDSYCKRQQ